ncbi:MAG: signal peptidase II [Oscillospiraceae bacterium]|nr:signal peptidase II [Oscillospiraceae bacterium]
MIYFLAVVLCVVLDQAVKFWTVGNLALHESAPLLPGIVELYYIQNTGGGFSILTGHTWFLSAVTAVLLTVLSALLIKKVFTHPLAVWTLVLVIGGGIGNLIDRVRLGYVVDMFNFQFMSYPVFNVADIFVVCGAIGFAIYYILLHDKVTGKTGETTEEKSHGEDDPAVS